MNEVAGGGVRWGCFDCFSLLSMQVGKLTREQRLRLKQDGRLCPDVKVKSRLCGAVYRSFSWICYDSEKNTYFCWPCLVMGDHSKLRQMLSSILIS